MAYYRTCPHCGASLDPGETCDCRVTLTVELTDEEQGELKEWVEWILGGEKKAAPRRDTAKKNTTKITPKVYHRAAQNASPCEKCPDRADCDSPCVRAVREGAI